MAESIPLYIIGSAEDESVKELMMSKFGGSLEKVRPVLSDIIEAKISVKYQK